MATQKYKALTRAFLTRRYVIEERQILDIAREVGCHSTTVIGYLRRYGFAKRNQRNTVRNAGDNIGDWLLLYPLVKLQNGNKKGYWCCKCTCGVTKEIETSCLNSNGSRACRACSNMKKQKSDPRIVPYIYFSRLQRTARTRGIACKVTYKQIKTRLEQQDGRCALSGLPIGFALGFPKHRVGETTASLDRIDSASGYTCDNIQWVHKDINRLKNAFPQTRFFELCKAVTEHQNATSPNLSP